MHSLHVATPCNDSAPRQLLLCGVIEGIRRQVMYLNQFSDSREPGIAGGDAGLYREEPQAQMEGLVTIEHLTSEDFMDKTDEGIVLVDFWAAWCAPCHAFAPVFERASRQHPDILFAKVDTQAEPELAEKFNIHSIPTVMAIRDGVVVFAQPGALPQAAIESLISQVKALDMEAVRHQFGNRRHPPTGTS